MSELPVRVRVQENWDEVTLTLPPEATVGDLKHRALECTRAADPDDAYEVKFRGALLDDESRTLGAVGVVPNAQLIVLARHRRPVR